MSVKDNATMYAGSSMSAPARTQPAGQPRWVSAAAKAWRLIRTGRAGLLVSIPLYRLGWRLRGLDFGITSVQELGLDPTSVNYHKDGGGPLLCDLLNHFPIQPTDAVLDLGSGKGGAMATLARYPFKAVHGVEISPELVPHTDEDRSRPAQSSQAKIGPYELQDFNLYFITRYGFRPSKVAYLGYHAWHDASRGDWPVGLREDQRNAYDLATIKHWLEVFLYRFFQISQFKRTCVPNAPKVGSGGSLSPRGDYRAPNDAEATAWLEQVQRIPDHENALLPSGQVV